MPESPMPQTSTSAKPINVLLIGSGGREHALAWKLAQSPRLATLYASPGNPGIAAHATIAALDIDDHAAVVGFARRHAIGLVVIGPEAPLMAGLADDLRAAGIAVFGPSKAAAALEGSKGFTKNLCAAHGIPTAAFVRHVDAAAAIADVARFGFPVVVKADGLAAGKGVVIAEDAATARDAIEAALVAPGAAIVIEAFMAGTGASLFALTDGTTIIPFASAQDHKRVGDGDTGPNTGGMGAFSPAVTLTPELQARAMREIVEPTVRAMAAAGTPFSGMLYAGLMLTPEGPKLVEYNARFGDPETQVLMPRFDGDLLVLLEAVAAGTLAAHPPLRFSTDVAVGVVVAAPGYPARPVPGGVVRGIAQAARHALVFHAGTRVTDGAIVAAGGRVLTVVASARDRATARDAAYRALAALDYPGGFWRRDIATA